MCRSDSHAATFAACRGWRKPSGFSLLDVVVVVVIVAILAAIALPSYRHAMLKARRAEGRALLQVVMAAEERYYATYNRYAATFGGEGISAAAESSPGRYYAVSSLDLADDGQLVVVTVEPRGAQSGDPCGKLTLDSLGRRGAAGPDDCR